MKAGVALARQAAEDAGWPKGIEPAGRFDVGVHLKLGERMDGLQVFHDGVSFRSPQPLPGGRLIELVLCNGSVLVDALIVGCLPLADGSYAVRARYHKTSRALNAMIEEELTAHLEGSTAGAAD